jgi:PAS domain S-box-containing protein
MQLRLSLRERLLVVMAAALLPVVVFSAWAVLREDRAASEPALAILAVMMLAAVACVWWIGGRMIVHPARQIVATAHRLQHGNLDARVPTHGSNPRGEFAQIAGAFNLMAESLQLRQSELEAELERSRSAYGVLDQVLNSMQDALVAVGLKGQFLLYNEAAARLFPLQDAPVLPQLWPEHFGFFRADGTTPYQADDLPLVRSVLGESGIQEQLFVRNALVPQGRFLQCSWRPIKGGGAVRGGLVVFTDMTELQRLQSERAAQFEQLSEAQRKLIESQRIGRVGNWELDLRTGRLWWSDEVYTLFGIAPADFDASLQGFEARVDPRDRPQLKPARDRALRDGEVMSVEYRVHKPDGSTAWMHEIAEARRDESGEPVWFGGVVQDITQRKRQEQALRDSEREIRELNASLESRIAERTAQLENTNQELEAFSYSVSHDLRAPLGAIAGFSRALEGKLQGQDERTLHYIGRIQAGVQKMEQLIESLLSLSRVARAPLESAEVDLGAIARETFEGLQVQHPERRVATEVQGKLFAHGDARLLRALMENLLGNAWKFTSREAAAKIEVGRVADSGVFYVRDNGVGFDMEYASKLFTAFQRFHSDSEFPGTGIGLATVRRIIARHQGRVWAESQVGRGATFYFSLP